MFGGNYDNGANAGLWYMNCNNDASNSNSNYGSRLAKNVCKKLIDYGQSSTQILRRTYPRQGLAKYKPNGSTSSVKARKWGYFFE